MQVWWQESWLWLFLIFFLGRASGLIGSDEPVQEPQVQSAEPTQTPEEEGLVEGSGSCGQNRGGSQRDCKYPSAGNQIWTKKTQRRRKGRISSQNLQPGTKVEKFTTIEYYISKGSEEVTIPYLEDEEGMPYTGIQAQKELEELGFVVDVQKIYSDYDENGYILVNPGYTYYTEPAAGASRNPVIP